MTGGLVMISVKQIRAGWWNFGLMEQAITASGGILPKITIRTEKGTPTCDVHFVTLLEWEEGSCDTTASESDR